MPTYQITAPDGATYEVTGDGSEQDALAHFQQEYAAQQQPQEDPRAKLLASNPGEYDPNSPQYQAKYGPTAGMTGVDKFDAGAGKAMVDIGRGIKQMGAEVKDWFAPRQQNLSSLITGAPTSRGDALRAQQDERRALDAPLMRSGAAKLGSVAGGVAVGAPAMFIPGANTVVGAGLVGAGMGAMQPVGTGESRALNTAIGGATGAATQYLGGKVSAWAGRKLEERTAKAATDEAQNAVRDATISEARKAGYVVPPATTNPTATNRIVESVAGKAQAQQSASVKNQKVTNNLVRKALGLGENVPINKGTLNAVRSKAGNVYKAIEAAGDIATDSQYIDDLSAIARSMDDVAKDFPDLNLNNNEQVGKLVDSLLQDSFSPKSALEATKQLRKAASANLSFLNSADPAKRALGYAQRDAAAAVEDQLVRHLEASGAGPLAKAFDESRRLIAKTYSVEAALNEGTGNVVAANLGSQLKKGKPLSGELELIAKFARSFDKASQEIRTSPGVSAVDAMIGGVGGITINPSLVALPAARIGTREAILTPWLNKAMGTQKYAPGMAGTAAFNVAKAGKGAALPASVIAAQRNNRE